MIALESSDMWTKVILHLQRNFSQPSQKLIETTFVESLGSLRMADVNVKERAKASFGHYYMTLVS